MKVRDLINLLRNCDRCKEVRIQHQTGEIEMIGGLCVTRDERIIIETYQSDVYGSLPLGFLLNGLLLLNKDAEVILDTTERSPSFVVSCKKIPGIVVLGY